MAFDPDAYLAKSNAPAFNPDSYLSGTQQGQFDPDAYLARTNLPVATAPRPVASPPFSTGQRQPAPVRPTDPNKLREQRAREEAQKFYNPAQAYIPQDKTRFSRLVFAYGNQDKARAADEMWDGLVSEYPEYAKDIEGWFTKGYDPNNVPKLLETRRRIDAKKAADAEKKRLEKQAKETIGPVGAASMAAVRAILPAVARPNRLGAYGQELAGAEAEQPPTELIPMTDVEQSVRQARPWSTFAGEVGGSVAGFVPFVKGAQALSLGSKLASKLPALEKALPTLSKYMPGFVDNLAAFNVHDQVFMPEDSTLADRAKHAALSSTMALAFSSTGAMGQAGKAGKYAEPIGNAAIGYATAKMSGEDNDMALVNALTFAALPYGMKLTDVVAKRVGPAVMEARVKKAATDMGVSEPEAKITAQKVVQGITDAAQELSVQPKQEPTVGATAPKPVESGPKLSTPTKHVVSAVRTGYTEGVSPTKLMSEYGINKPVFDEIISGKYGRGKWNDNSQAIPKGEPNAPIQEVQAEGQVIPEGFHEIKTVTRAAELSEGKGPFAPEARVAREAGSNLAETTPVKSMVQSATEQATVDPYAALKAAKDAVDPKEKAARYVGYLEARKAKGEVAQEAFDALAKEGSAAGTVLRIVRELKLGTPEGRADMWMQLFTRWAKKSGAELPKDSVAEIRSRFEKAESLTDDAARNEATQDAINFSVLNVPRSRAMWNAYRYSNVLSNPRSHIRNLSGNAVQLAIVRPAALIFKGNIKGAKTFAVEAGKAFGKGVDAFMQSMRGDAPPSKTFEQSGTTVFDAALQKRLPKALTFVNRMMEGGDMMARAMIEAGETARLVQSGVKPETAQARAKELSEQYLYRQNLGVEMKDPSQSVVTRALDSGGYLLDKVRSVPVLGPLMSPVLMFVRTPMNIAKSGVKTSPLGYLGNLTKDGVAKGRYNKPFNKLTPDEQVLVNEELGNRVGLARLGVAVTAIGSLLAATNRTTWAPPKDEESKKLFYDSGMKPYSIKIGDKWVPMWTFGPLALSLAIPAAARDVMIDNPKYSGSDMGTKLIAVAQNMAKYVITQSPFSSVQSFMDNVTGDVYDPGKFLAFTSQQFIPASGLINYVNQWIDPTYRKASGFKQNMKASIPGLSQDVPAHTTTEGEDAVRTLMDILPPFSIGQENKDYSQRYKSRNEELKSRATHNREITSIAAEVDSGKKPVSEVYVYANQFSEDERVRLLQTVKSRYPKIGIASKSSSVISKRDRGL